MKRILLPVFVIFLMSVSLVGLRADDSTKSKTDTTQVKKNPTPKVENEKINWLTYPEGLQKLKTEKKHLFIDFTASWCGWCRRMEAEAFSEPEVIKTVNDKFIPVRVWGDSDEMLDISGYKISQRNLTHAQFGVNGFPTFWFVSPEGVRIGPLRGYQTSPVLIDALKWVSEYKYDTTRVENKTDPSGE